jgi:hypothetical protein
LSDTLFSRILVGIHGVLVPQKAAVRRPKRRAFSVISRPEERRLLYQ